MNSIQTILTLVCVVAISCGQLLFKRIGFEIQILNNWLSWRVLFITALAFFIYGCATILWIYVLRNVELSKAYMFMSLSFIAVPIGSSIFFDERLSATFFLGMGIVIIGIFVIVKYG